MTALTRTHSKPPVRALHLGLGNFFRAHQAWYTQHAGDGAQWGIAAFTGLSGPVAEILSTQDSLYTLDVRSPDGDEYEVIESLAAVHTTHDPLRPYGCGALCGLRPNCTNALARPSSST